MGLIMETKTEETLTVQAIVDLYWLKKDYKEMTKQIDLYAETSGYPGATDFFWNLAEELEEFQEHVDDWSIFTGMVKEYLIIKADNKEREEEEARIKLLSQFARWTAEGMELVNIDKEQVKLHIDNFLEEME